MLLSLKCSNKLNVGKKHVSTSCDDLLAMPCSSIIDACSTSFSCETNLLKENNELKSEVKKLNKVREVLQHQNHLRAHDEQQKKLWWYEWHWIQQEHDQGERKRERKIKKQEQKRLSHFMCFKCHEMGHLANGCPNEEKLKLKKEEERLKHVKCFECRTWGHLTSMCPTKQLVKHKWSLNQSH